jgi:hypothetical protein
MVKPVLDTPEADGILLALEALFVVTVGATLNLEAGKVTPTELDDEAGEGTGTDTSPEAIAK